MENVDVKKSILKVREDFYKKSSIYTKYSSSFDANHHKHNFNIRNELDQYRELREWKTKNHKPKNHCFVEIVIKIKPIMLVRIF